MKGKLFKFTDFFRGIRMYRISYIPDMGEESIFEDSLNIQEEDMAEFMDDIFSDWMKESFKKEYCESGYVKDMFKAVITLKEREDQDRDERERD